jgi:hypothetical protein
VTTITLEVPDELARRLDAERDRLPRVLSWALRKLPPRRDVRPAASASPPQAFTEMITFLSSQPTPEQIHAFKISAQAQARLSALLEKNREIGLDEVENAELDWYEYVHDIMARLKAQTRQISAN